MTAEDGSLYLGNGYYPSLTLETLTAETPALQLEIKVFPNPVNEAVFITHPTKQFFEVRITDISGKQILKTTQQSRQPLSLQTLTTGTYFINVITRDSKQTNTYKIIKNSVVETYYCKKKVFLFTTIINNPRFYSYEIKHFPLFVHVCNGFAFNSQTAIVL